MNESNLEPNHEGEASLMEVREIPNPYKIPVSEMVERYEKLYTGAAGNGEHCIC